MKFAYTSLRFLIGISGHLNKSTETGLCWFTISEFEIWFMNVQYGFTSQYGKSSTYSSIAYRKKASFHFLSEYLTCKICLVHYTKIHPNLRRRIHCYYNNKQKYECKLQVILLSVGENENIIKGKCNIRLWNINFLPALFYKLFFLYKCIGWG